MAGELSDADIETFDRESGPTGGPGAGGLWSAPCGEASESGRGTPALERCVGDVRAFFDNIWGRRTFVYRSNRPFDDLLGLDDVDRIITSSNALRVSSLRLMKNGRAIPPSSYISTATRGRETYGIADVDRMLTLVTRGLADPEKVLRAIDSGATLVLQGIHNFHGPIAGLCRELETALGHRCQVNAYVTPPGAQGLSAHSDPHDVLVMQAFGSKTWEVHPTPWENEQTGDLVPVEVTLSPGQVLYLPKGTVHAARAQDEMSGHITVGVLATSWSEVVLAVAELLSADVDDDLPPAWFADPDSTSEMLVRKLDQLGQAIRDCDTRGIVADRVREFFTTRRRILPQAFVDRQRLPDMSDRTWLRLRPGVAPVFSPVGDEHFSVLLGDRELRMPAAVRPALTIMAERGDLTPADLSGVLNHDARLVLCRRLVREGMLQWN